MKTENRQKTLVILTITALGLLIGDSFVVKPLIHEWQARSTEITDLRNRVKNGHDMIAREQTIRNHWADMQGNTLPNNTAVAEQQLISAFTSWARQSGVEIASILPQWKNDTDDYKTLNCRVEVAGPINTLSQFLYDVEAGPMALKVDSVEFSTRDTAGQQLTLGLQVSCLSLINNSKP